ncbi:MAG TPA: hypothetical protein VHJ78_01635 [Actinomycetota bacterium]|nr:hypothetical protein [Actinomycetota bacterium]
MPGHHEERISPAPAAFPTVAELRIDLPLAAARHHIRCGGTGAECCAFLPDGYCVAPACLSLAAAAAGGRSNLDPDAEPHLYTTRTRPDTEL